MSAVRYFVPACQVGALQPLVCWAWRAVLPGAASSAPAVPRMAITTAKGSERGHEVDDSGDETRCLRMRRRLAKSGPARPRTDPPPDRATGARGLGDRVPLLQRCC